MLKYRSTIREDDSETNNESKIKRFLIVGHKQHRSRQQNLLIKKRSLKIPATEYGVIW
jgi:hypothetical protein